MTHSEVPVTWGPPQGCTYPLGYSCRNYPEFHWPKTIVLMYATLVVAVHLKLLNVERWRFRVANLLFGNPPVRSWAPQLRWIYRNETPLQRPQWYPRTVRIGNWCSAWDRSPARGEPGVCGTYHCGYTAAWECCCSSESNRGARTNSPERRGNVLEAVVTAV